MTKAAVINESEAPNSAGHGRTGRQEGMAKEGSNNKCDPTITSDSATPETGDEDADHSTASDKLSETEMPLTGGADEGNSRLDSYSQPPAPQTPTSNRSARRLGKDKRGSEEAKTKIPARSEGSEEAQEFDYSEYEDGESRQDKDVKKQSAMHDAVSDAENDDSSSDYSAKADSLIWRFRMMCGKAVNNEYVQITVIALIVINALMMGVATFDFVMDDPDVDLAFSKVDKAFLVVFTVEVAMQLVYLGLSLFADGWLLFDLLIVVLSWSFEGLQIVRAFRIFRAFRLITRVKPLRDLVLAIGAVMPRMYAIAALLMLIFYIFSVLFTELFSELPLSEPYFVTLDASLFTCMQMMTLEWGDVAREVISYEPWAWAPFSAFILISGFIVYNLIVAVVCDAVSVTEKTVRQLDGFESDNPVNKLAEAQERIDLLQCHINDMLRTQENVQNLVEMMASELLHLEAERMKAEHREAELRIEMSRRMIYQHDMQSDQQIHSLERHYIQEKEKREHERKLKELQRKSSIQSDRDQEDSLGGSRHSRILPSPQKKPKKPAGPRGGFMKQMSFKRRDSGDFSARSLEEDSAPPLRGFTKENSRESVQSGLSGSSRS